MLKVILNTLKGLFLNDLILYFNNLYFNEPHNEILLMRLKRNYILLI